MRAAIQPNLLVSSAVLMVTAAIHATLGWADVVVPVLASSTPAVAAFTVAMAWHMLTVSFVVMGGWLGWHGWVGQPLGRASACMGVAYLLGHALCALAVGGYALGNVGDLPQWILFAAAAAPLLRGCPQSPCAVLIPRIRRSAALRNLPIARAIGCISRLAARPDLGRSLAATTLRTAS